MLKSQNLPFNCGLQLLDEAKLKVYERSDEWEAEALPVISDLNIVHLPLDPMLVALVGRNHIHQNLQLSLPADGKFFRTRGRSQLVAGAAGGEWAGRWWWTADLCQWESMGINGIRSTDILSQNIIHLASFRVLPCASANHVLLEKKSREGKTLFLATIRSRRERNRISGHFGFCLFFDIVEDFLVTLLCQAFLLLFPIVDRRKLQLVAGNLQKN